MIATARRQIDALPVGAMVRQGKRHSPGRARAPVVPEGAEQMSPPGPKSSPVPRMGNDVANIARHTDRLDNVESAILRIERKVDMLVAATLTPKKVERR